jgi:hypothetical protein
MPAIPSTQFIVDPSAIEDEFQEIVRPRVLRQALKNLYPGGMLTDNVSPGGAEPSPGGAQASALPSAVERYRNRASELYKQGADLYAQEPDMSQFEEFARQRSEGGNAAMLNALAAQFAGEQFQPVQAQFLKKAAAAQEPMKLGSGMLTADGKYLKDPIAAQDKRAEFLLQQARAYETLAQTAATAEERAEAARLARESNERYREMTAEIQRANVESQISNRELMGSVAQDRAEAARLVLEANERYRDMMVNVAAQNAETAAARQQADARNQEALGASQIENRNLMAAVAQQNAETAAARARADAQNQSFLQGIARDNADTRRMMVERDRSGPGGSFSQSGFTPQGQQIVTNRSGMNFLLGVQADGRPSYTPYQGPIIPKASFDKEVMAAADLSSVASRADGLVKKIEQNPGAFGLRSAAVSAVPGALQSYAAAAVGLTPQQLEARSTVLRQAAQEINELYGAALSMGEQARANTFLPNPSDTPDMLISKLKAARDWAKTQLGRYSPGVMNAATSRGGGSAGGGSSNAPAVGTVKDGYRFKGGDPAQASNWEKL